MFYPLKTITLTSLSLIACSAGYGRILDNDFSIRNSRLGDRRFSFQTRRIAGLGTPPGGKAYPTAKTSWRADPARSKISRPRFRFKGRAVKPDRRFSPAMKNSGDAVGFLRSKRLKRLEKALTVPSLYEEKIQPHLKIVENEQYKNPPSRALSLRDLNTYLFRRDRSSEPGFPVEKAGVD